MQKQIKKIFSVLLAFCFVLPSIAFGAGEFEVVTRLKNITAGDSEAGAIYTMAQSGDELRHLIIVTNHENYERDYTAELNLPIYLSYAEGSLEKYQGSWSSTDDLALHLMPDETAFLRFTSHVTEDLPNENLILGIGVEVTDSQGVELSSLTKVYIPNFNAEEELGLEGVSEEDEQEIKQIYQEEKEQIEHVFEKDTEDTEEVEDLQEEMFDNLNTQDVDMLNLYIGAVIASLLLLYLIIAYVRKK